MSGLNTICRRHSLRLERVTDEWTAWAPPGVGCTAPQSSPLFLTQRDAVKAILKQVHDMTTAQCTCGCGQWRAETWCSAMHGGDTELAAVLALADRILTEAT